MVSDIPWLPVAAWQFSRNVGVAGIRIHGSGNVNDTFLVTPGSAGARAFVLQRINSHVFQRPEWIMANMRVVTGHMAGRLDRVLQGTGRRWEVPAILKARDGRDFWIDPAGSFWRALRLIEGAQSRDTVGSAGEAREVGFALGTFQRLLSDLPPGTLFDTLEGFHVTPRYLRHYDEVLAGNQATRSSEERYGATFVSDRRRLAGVLEEARREGRLHLRAIHGDPKVNNVMIDAGTGQAVGMIDLDTVKPGLVHYDIGDCLRSCCNPLGEETGRWEEVRFDTGLCRAVLEGYLGQARAFLTPPDYEYLYEAVRLITFELGLRFFTDHLEGNIYFRARREGHNLARALVQFRLAESIEVQEPAIRRIIRDLR